MVECANLIIATGGIHGRNLVRRRWLEIAASLGHKIRKPVACLVPLVTMEKWVGELAGVGVGQVKMIAKMGGEKVRTEG